MARLLDIEDAKIYAEAMNGSIVIAFRMFYRYYFNIEQLSIKQEAVALAGWNPAAIGRNGSIDFEILFLVRQILAIGGIRSGKTFSACLGILFQMWLLADIDCLNVAPSVDQASTMYRMALSLIASPRFDKFVRKPDGSDGIVKHPYPMIWMWNGSCFEFRSTGYECELIRSREYDRINADECQLIREAGIRTLQGRLVGRKLTTGRQRMGVMSMTGSPLSRVRWLRQMFDEADPENPHCNPAHLAIRFSIFDNIKNLGKRAVEELYSLYKQAPQLIEQELEGRFVDSSEVVFPGFESAFLQTYDGTADPKTGIGIISHLEDRIAESRGNSPFDSEMTEYSLPPERDHIYLASWDVGKGMTQRSKDIEALMGRRGATVGLVLDVTNRPWQMVAYKYMIRNYQWGPIIDSVRSWKQKYFDCLTVWDKTGVGDPIDEWAGEQGVEIDLPITLTGSTTSGERVAKSHMLNQLQLAFNQDWLKMPFLKVPYAQVEHYEPDDKNMPQDFVMALAGAVWHASLRDRVARRWAAGQGQVDVKPGRRIGRRQHIPRLGS